MIFKKIFFLKKLKKINWSPPKMVICILTEKPSRLLLSFSDTFMHNFWTYALNKNLYDFIQTHSL